MFWIIEKLKHEALCREKMLGTTPPTEWEGSLKTWDMKEREAIASLREASKILENHIKNKNK